MRNYDLKNPKFNDGWRIVGIAIENELVSEFCCNCLKSLGY